MRIFIIYFLLLLISCKQNNDPINLKEFNGKLEFEEVRYDYDNQLKEKNILIYSKEGNQIQIKKILLKSDRENDTIEYIPISFQSSNDTVYVCYDNSIKEKKDSEPLFSTVRGRSISGLDNYLLKVDSVFEYYADESIEFSRLEIPMTLSISTYTRDSILICLGTEFNCYIYRHEERNMPAWGGMIDVRKEVFVEKNSLIPIKIIAYVRRDNYRKPNNKWVRRYETILRKISDI